MGEEASTPPTNTGSGAAPERPRPPRALLVAAVLAAVAVIVTGVLAFGGDDTPSAGDISDSRDGTGVVELEPALEGAAAPELTFTTFDGEERTFADYEGQPLVVNFFASWCAPCVAEMPDIEAVHQELGDQVQFLGMNFSDRRSDADGIIDQTGITYEVASDRDGEVFEAFEANAMPTTVFIDAEGRVVDLRSGKLSEDELRRRVERLMAG